TRQRANFIEKKCTPISFSKLPDATDGIFFATIAPRSRDTKENLVGIIHSQATAIDGHERAAPTSTTAANGTCQRLLAATGLSLDQQWGIQRRSPSRQNTGPLHFGAFYRHVGKRQMGFQRRPGSADFLRQRINLQDI